MSRHDPGTHLDETLTASYLDGALGGEALDAVEAHLASCERCRSGVALLRRMARDDADLPGEDLLMKARGPATVVAGAAMPAAGRALAESGGSSRRLVATALAAVALVTVGLTLWFLPGGSGAPPKEPGYRGADTGHFGPIEPAAGSSVAAEDLSFRWSPEPGADRYLLLVISEKGDLAGSFEVRAPAESAPWPADRSLPPPGSYAWKVRALALGRPIAESRPVPFEVR